METVAFLPLPETANLTVGSKLLKTIAPKGQKYPIE
jgi:hypothetical protein